MAVQQLTQPIVNPIAAFDATMPQEITFLVIGGAQVIGNRIVISDNQTGNTVYDNRITSMKLAQTIPANTLTNGGYYNVVVYTIDSGSNYSQPSVPVPFYCYSQPNLTISNIPSSETIENGTYSFQGNYSQIEGEALNSYQFILYDSNKNILSQSDIIYYTADGSLNYTFVGMSNDTSYYVELKGQTVNNTLLTSGLLYFTVRYKTPVSFAIVDLVNDCENGFIQISSNVVAIDGKSNPEPPKYIDNKEVDLRDPDSWVKWDEGFDIKDDFTMRVWGRDFNDFEPIITLSNKNDADGQPNRIEMKWMVGDVIETLPDYTLVEGKNISIVNGYKTDISDLSIYGNSEQIKQDSIDFGTANSMTIDTTKSMYLDFDVYGNQYQKTQEASKESASGEEINLTDVDSTTKATITQINGNNYQKITTGQNIMDFNVTQNSKVTANNDGTVTINGNGGFSLNIAKILLKAGTTYYQKVELVSGTVSGVSIDQTFAAFYGAGKWISSKGFTESYIQVDDIKKTGVWVHANAVFDNAVIKLWGSSVKMDFEPYGTLPSPTPNSPSVVEAVGLLKLPTEYQEVEYIESSGSEYIDTDVAVKKGLSVDLKMQYTKKYVVDGGFIFGSRNGSNMYFYLGSGWSWGNFGWGYGKRSFTNINSSSNRYRLYYKNR